MILTSIAVVAIVAGGLLHLVGEGPTGHVVWRAAVALLAAELSFEVAIGPAYLNPSRQRTTTRSKLGRRAPPQREPQAEIAAASLRKRSTHVDTLVQCAKSKRPGAPPTWVSADRPDDRVSPPVEGRRLGLAVPRGPA